eukprot:m.78989 g.78989  ORF g.78989 m.78989 type:complete len:477 (+) comp8590_c0_seq1:120-1550(+)
MEAPDSLTLLRQYCKDGVARVEGSEIIIGQWAIKKEDATNYSIRGNSSVFYTNEAIFHYIQHRDKTFKQYMKVTSINLRIVRTDLKNLKNFLETGVVNNSIIEMAPVSFARFVGGTTPSLVDASLERGTVATTASTTSTAFEGTSESKSEPVTKRAHLDKLDPSLSTITSASSKQEVKLTSAKRAEIKAKRERRKREIAVSAATHAINRNELVFMSRNSVLKAPGKDFSSVLQLLKRKEEEEREQKRKRKEVPTYTRYGQKGEVVDQGLFNLNLAGSSYKPGSSAKDTKYIGSSSNDDKKNPSEKQETKRVSKTPIIIVPAGMSEVITLSNVRQFLENGVYIPPLEAAKLSKREDSVLVNRKKKGGLVKYRVVDRPQILAPTDWDRVVAVFVSGKKWQFKQWPEMKQNKSEVDIFTKRRAFHVMFDDAKLNPNVAQWDCKILQISRSRRHMDQTAVHDFWEVLDQWTLTRFSDLIL